MRYLFGDSDLAAHRLEIVHEVFSQASRPLLQETAAAKRIGLAMDLGCGPGVCTRFLAEVTGCDRAVGLDNSERFIALAQARSSARVQFRLHDVAAVPFPVGPADLMYCRFLLTHLREPEVMPAQWATQLQPGGRLVMEEVEQIDAADPTLRTYLEVLAALLAHQGGRLYIGPALNRLPEPEGLHRELSEVTPLPVSTAKAATMFLMNLQAWKNEAFVRARFGDTTIASIETRLRELTEIDARRSDIEWGMRQILYRRG